MSICDSPPVIAFYNPHPVSYEINLRYNSNITVLFKQLNDSPYLNSMLNFIQVSFCSLLFFTVRVRIRVRVRVSYRVRV